MEPEVILVDQPSEELGENVTNGLFDVVVVVDRSVFPTVSDGEVTETFTRVAERMEKRLGVTPRLQAILEIPALGKGKINFYSLLDTLAEMPEGVVLFSHGSFDRAETYGGYSTTVALCGSATMVPPVLYCNEFASPHAGSSSVYIAVVDWDHYYSRCGYDEEGNQVRDVSANGECHNMNDVPCVWNGEYSICESALHHPYAVPGEFRVATIIHEFLHPFGVNGNLDHYGTAVCVAMMNGELLPEPPEDYFNMCPPVMETFAESYVGCL
jgi:hypothetical protein